MHISLVSLAFVLGLAASSPAPVDQHSKRAPGDGKLPVSYIAFGDSYSAGIGAGRFLRTSSDGADNECGRTSGSYPYDLQSKNPRVFDPSLGLWKDFRSCTGDVLSALTAQLDGLGGKKYEVATLLMGGNDFFFGQIARQCMYKFGTQSPDAASLECGQYLTRVEAIFNHEIEDAQFVTTYQNYLDRIYRDVLNNNGLLLVTGYAKFFSPNNLGDNNNCQNLFTSWRGINSRVPLRTLNRLRMNRMVDTINTMIRDEVVNSRNNPNIRFIDIDREFENHRFCEAVPDPLGANNPEVWFTELNTTPLTDEAFTPRKDAYDRDRFELGSLGGILPTTLQQFSCLHPKPQALKVISDRMAYHVISWSEDRNPMVDKQHKAWLWGPDQICLGLGPSSPNVCYDIPANCGASKPVDNTIPTVFCRDSSFQARPVGS